MPNAKTAFTLVEMLVAIAVAALLAGLLVPCVTAARDAARTTECTSNLRQWGIAVTIYVNTNEGCIPRRGQGIQVLQRIDRAADWFNCLPPAIGLPSYKALVAAGRQPRAGDRSLFICPTAVDPGATRFLPYGMNMYLSPWIRPEPHNISEIDSPSTLVFMGDAPGQFSATAPCRKLFSPAPRHAGKANLLFLDGHVQSFSAEYLGCGVGDPRRSDVRWLTGTSGVNQEPVE